MDKDEKDKSKGVETEEEKKERIKENRLHAKEKKEFLETAMKRYERENKKDKSNREKASDDQKFLNLDQWSNDDLDTRKQLKRPALVFDELNRPVNQIIGEMRIFDEDRVLYQFRRTGRFNRHARFDCDNPKTEVEGDFMQIEISPLYRDAALYPIDFFVVHRDVLYIIPVEALTDGALPMAELDKWRARTPDGITLPASFRQRFGREVAAINQPMT